MAGTIFFVVRMVLYPLFGALALDLDWVSFEQSTGWLSVQVDSAGQFLGGLAGIVVTWGSSRWAKARGMKT